MNDETNKESVLASIEAFSDQCQQAWDETNALVVDPAYKDIQNVIVCGMGGSRFTPLTVKYLFADRIKVPYEICDDYHLPNYANNQTLVIFSSYSGSTEEVLSCYEEASKKKCLMAVVSNGGMLAQIAQGKNFLSYIFEERFNPSKQPRLGVGYMLFGHLGLLRALGLLDISPTEVTEAIEYLKTFDAKETAQKLAEDIRGNEAFIIGAEHLKGAVNGFANQINESGKEMSSYRFLSELNHHLLEGLGFPTDLKSRWLFVFFESPLYSPKITRRIPITKEVVEKQGGRNYSYRLLGKTKLAQVLEAFSLSGYTSYYLSQLNGVDPKTIPWVDYFKVKLG